MRSLLILLLPIFIISCSPQKKFARMLKKHPEFIKKDTIFKDTTLYTKPKEINGEIDLVVNSRIDSLLNLLGKDTSYNVNIINEIHKTFVNYPIIQDTFVVDTMGVKFTLYQSGNSLKYRINIGKDSANFTYNQNINSIEIKEPKKLRWYEKLWNEAQKWLAFIGFIALVFILAELILRRK